MAAHLSHLPTCDDCGGAAYFALRNTRNAVNGYYCKRHGPARLKAFWKEYPQEAPPKEVQADSLAGYRETTRKRW